MMEISFRELLRQHYPRMEKIVQKRFAPHQYPHSGGEDATSSMLCDEALDYLVTKLERESGKMVGKYDTIPYFWIQSRITDFIRQKFKNYGVPNWIKAFGPMWEEVYKRLCWERMGRSSVVDSVTESVPGGRDSDEVENIVDSILEKEIHCGKQNLEIPESSLSKASEPDETDHNSVLDTATVNRPEDASPEKLLAHKQVRAIIDFLMGDSGKQNNAVEDQTISRIVGTLQAQVKLKEEEKLFLRLYTDGMGIVRAGGMIGWDPNQSRGKYNTIKNKIRRAFKHENLQQLGQIIRDYVQSRL